MKNTPKTSKISEISKTTKEADINDRKLIEIEILKKFDLDSRFGPCYGNSL